MIEAKNFFDSRLNPEGQGLDNDFHLQQENSVIFDAATGLTWQQSGSERFFSYGERGAYVQKLNSESFGGYVDWRLPTLEEAMTILEADRSDHDLNISNLFDGYQTQIWTSDAYSASGAWAVRFEIGYCGMGGGSRRRLVDSFLSTCCVRAVRGGPY